MQNRPTNTRTDRPAASQTNGHQNRPSNAGTGKPAPKRINQHQNRANAAKPHLKSPKRAQQGKLQNTHTHTHTRTCTRAHTAQPPPQGMGCTGQTNKPKTRSKSTKPNQTKHRQDGPTSARMHHPAPQDTQKHQANGHSRAQDKARTHTHTHTHTHTYAIGECRSCVPQLQSVKDPPTVC